MFYEALQEAAGELEIDLRAVIEGFVNQKSNAIVSVNYYNGGILRVIKKSIVMPYNLITSSMEFPSEIKWLNGSFDALITIPTLGEEGWYLMNVGQFGFYRVNYDVANWRALINALRNNPQVFSSETRAQLIDDSLSLAMDGFLSYSIALDLLTALGEETSFLPWNAAMKNLLHLNNFLEASDVHHLEFQVKVPLMFLINA